MSAFDLLLTPPEGSARDRGNKFYQILGGGARMKALEAFLDLQIPQLLNKEGEGVVATYHYISLLRFHHIHRIYRSNGIHENMRKVRYCPK
jgi:hypothetical protein